jgi:hypothetical protein
VADDLKGLPETVQEMLRPFPNENPHKKDNEEKKWKLDFERYYHKNQNPEDQTDSQSKAHGVI